LKTLGTLVEPLLQVQMETFSPYQMALLSLSSNIVYPKPHHVSLHNHTSMHSFIKLFSHSSKY
jgi:hypothetical protein